VGPGSRPLVKQPLDGARPGAPVRSRDLARWCDGGGSSTRFAVTRDRSDAVRELQALCSQPVRGILDVGAGLSLRLPFVPPEGCGNPQMEARSPRALALAGQVTTSPCRARPAGRLLLRQSCAKLGLPAGRSLLRARACVKDETQEVASPRRTRAPTFNTGRRQPRDRKPRVSWAFLLGAPRFELGTSRPRRRAAASVGKWREVASFSPFPHSHRLPQTTAFEAFGGRVGSETAI
jgi:hypothetical protein